MAHYIVVGNEKGGTGKSTLAMTIAVALSRIGKRTGVVDLDIRQESLTRFCENRAAFRQREKIALPGPRLSLLPSATPGMVGTDQGAEQRLTQALTPLDQTCDFIVIDCPGAHTRFSQLAHGLADTLVTPLNDSFIDFDLLARTDPFTGQVIGPSVYANLVNSARDLRARAGLVPADWIVLRNRMGSALMHNTQKLTQAMKALSAQIGFRFAPGLSERVIYRELFPRGLTLLDLREAGVSRLNASNKAARGEVLAILKALNLPDCDFSGL